MIHFPEFQITSLSWPQYASFRSSWITQRQGFLILKGIKGHSKFMLIPKQEIFNVLLIKCFTIQMQIFSVVKQVNCPRCNVPSFNKYSLHTIFHCNNAFLNLQLVTNYCESISKKLMPWRGRRKGTQINTINYQ